MHFKAFFALVLLITASFGHPFINSDHHNHTLDIEKRADNDFKLEMFQLLDQDPPATHDQAMKKALEIGCNELIVSNYKALYHDLLQQFPIDKHHYIFIGSSGDFLYQVLKVGLNQAKTRPAISFVPISGAGDSLFYMMFNKDKSFEQGLKLIANDPEIEKHFKAYLYLTSMKGKTPVIIDSVLAGNSMNVLSYIFTNSPWLSDTLGPAPRNQPAIFAVNKQPGTTAEFQKIFTSKDAMLQSWDRSYESNDAFKIKNIIFKDGLWSWLFRARAPNKIPDPHMDNGVPGPQIQKLAAQLIWA